MTVEELVTKLGQFPPEMQVKVVTLMADDVISVLQDGEDYVRIIVGQRRER